MDPKAAAKSKRSQSQQGKRNHPTPSAVSARAQQKKKESFPQQQQPQHQGGQSSRRHLRDLPSNWDRYDDDETDVGKEGGPVPGLVDSGGPAAVATMPLSGGGDVVARKSRGANFGFLIDQARSQIRDRDHGDGASALASTYLFDEAMPDLFQGFGSLVSVRGESLVSWCNNDNFNVDTDARSTFEVPFLSLDLDSLAAQISKLSAAERLFIEEDLLPTELLSEGSEENFPEGLDQVKARNISESRDSLNEGASKSYQEDIEQVPGGQSKPLSASSISAAQDLTFTLEGAAPAAAVAAAAEVELDRLLMSSQSCSEGGRGSVGKPAAVSPLEDTIDDILAEAEGSYSSDMFGESSGSSRLVPLESSIDALLAEVNLLDSSSSASLNVVTGSRDRSHPRAGHGSRHAGPEFSVDESIDDLLAETPSSGVKMRDVSQNPPGKLEIHRTKPAPASKALEDLDALLDSI
ncbi:unnamed protein product [Spirodela intermedia]|uniref:Uncharacterized protein n=1 Tax=Spirodela intermedia TaxID=51605 RepID=A0A7I8KXL3_SPIIN|nr:unnamed protein product [Spirodela intermedia]